MEPVVLTVSQITSAIKMTLESTFSIVWVRGEISNLKRQASGHIYFSLIEKEAQVACVLFKGVSTRYPLPLKDGDDILISGELTVYAPRGGYQIIIRSIQLTGAGEKLLQLQALKQKLQALGWTHPERKRALPKEIKTIALVTSPTGAVLQDILTILQRRMVGFHLIVNPVRVQGDGAAAEIEKAIDQVSQHKLGDVVIVCRGGGSAEDLSPFNEERVARAIVECSIPVISAVGHETDFTIADLVADLRAPTPSAAAELVSHEKEALLKRFHHLSTTLEQKMRAYLQSTRTTLRRFMNSRQLTHSPQKLLSSLQRIDDLSEALEVKLKSQLKFKNQQLMKLQRLLLVTSPISKLNATRKEISLYEQKLHKSSSLILERKRRKLESYIQQLTLLSPKNVLQRGYALITRPETGGVISSAGEVNLQQEIRVQFFDGTIDANVVRKIEIK